MKKILASLLSLTMLCSSVAVFCSAEQGKKCPEGKHLVNENACCPSGYNYIVNNYCSECPEGKHLVDGQICCPNGYNYIVNGKCFGCREGYHLVNENACCSNEYNYIVDGKCRKCPEGEHLVDGQSCCLDGYNYIVDGECSKCPEGEHLVDGQSCCSDGYNYIVNGKCRKCPKGYYIVSENACCENGWYYDREDKKCIKGPENEYTLDGKNWCPIEYYITHDSCSKCPEGYIFRNGKCDKCEEGKHSVNGQICCPNGYNYIVNGKCSKCSATDTLKKCGCFERKEDGIQNEVKLKTKECSDGHKLIDKHCCPIGYNYIVNNSCSKCPVNQELVGNECLTKCEDGDVRGADGNCTQNKLESKTDAEITVSNNWDNFKTTSINLINKASNFYAENQKELAVIGITTVAVALVGTTIYIFRNEIKDLAKKIGTSIKKVFEKKNDQVKVNN